MPIKKALEWATEKAETEVRKAISAVKQRHVDSTNGGLTKLGDALILDAAERLKSREQMSFLGTKMTCLPPPLLNSYRADYYYRADY